MTPKLHTVHIRINDAATGQPTACRVRFTDAAGTYYAPLGWQSDFSRGWREDLGRNLHLEYYGGNAKGEIDARKYAFIDGTCEIALPSGSIHVEVRKGFEYKPIIQQIALPAGKMTLRLTLERWINLRQRGWYSGDARCHFLSPHDALLEAGAEDLAVVDLLIKEVALRGDNPNPNKPVFRRNQRPAVTNLFAFSGQRPCLELPDRMVAVNTHNYHGLKGEAHNDAGPLGSLSLLNCHRIIHPLRFGGAHWGTDNWTLGDWCDQCHRRGGLVVWSDVKWSADIEDSNCGEALANLILEKVDALEFQPSGPVEMIRDWHMLLNCGIRVPVVGCSAKEWNNHPLGIVRTYARLQAGEALTYGHWTEAIRAGRTFVTTQPLLFLTVDGHEPGATIRLERPTKVHVRADARSWEPFRHLNLGYNGDFVTSVQPTGFPFHAAIDQDIEIFESGWLSLWCSGDSVYIMTNGGTYAVTSPIYVMVDEQPMSTKPEAVQVLNAHLERMLEWVRTQARCDDEEQRERLAGIFEAAREVLRTRSTV